MFHQNIRVPGVYIINSSSANGMQGAPIFCTMSNMTILGMNDASERALVFPKYKVIFNDGQNNTYTIDNTEGTKCIYTVFASTILNGASSCQVYYANEEITNIFSTTGT